MENTKREEMVTLTRGQLEALQADVAALKSGQGIVKPKRVTDRTATIRFYKDKPVVWYGSVNETKDEFDHNIATMKIKLHGEEKLEAVNYLDFLNSRGEYESNSYPVDIKKQTIEEKRKVVDKRIAENPQQTHDSRWQPFETEMVVVSREYEATIEVTDGPHKGETFVVPSLCLNQ